jgi:RNA 3'-terminal phosphate cyclase (ATP)
MLQLPIMQPATLTIDGRMGEGGGQVLRTSLSLAALTGRSFRLTHIRANRSKPGLRPQHLTAVRAAARLCGAALSGDAIDSRTLEFRPAMPPQPGHYHFDVSAVAGGGSAGAVTLIAQTLLWPLLFAGGPSRVTLRGGTHVPMSPPWHYLAHVVRPVAARMGATFDLELRAWGWYPAGGGEATMTIQPLARLDAPPFAHIPVERVEGIAAVTNLPADIPQRMAGRATNLLAAAGRPAKIEPRRENGAGPGAGIFLWLPQGGFSALGRPGLPSEKVAEAAVAETLAFVDNTAMVDRHLADQLLLPLALAHGRARYTTDHVTLHTVPNAELLRLWLDTKIDIAGELGEPAEIDVTGVGFTPG